MEYKEIANIVKKYIRYEYDRLAIAIDDKSVSIYVDDGCGVYHYLLKTKYIDLLSIVNLERELALIDLTNNQPAIIIISRDNMDVHIVDKINRNWKAKYLINYDSKYIDDSVKEIVNQVNKRRV